MPYSRSQLIARLANARNRITNDNELDFDEWLAVMTDLVESVYNAIDDGIPIINGGAGSAYDLSDDPIDVVQGSNLICVGNSITGHNYYHDLLSDYIDTPPGGKQVYYNAGESTRGTIKRILQDLILNNRTGLFTYMNGINDIRFNNRFTPYKRQHVDWVLLAVSWALAHSYETAGAAAAAGRAYAVGAGSWSPWTLGLSRNGTGQAMIGTDNVSMRFNMPAGLEAATIGFFTNATTDGTLLSRNVEIRAYDQVVGNINLHQQGQNWDHMIFHIPDVFFEPAGGGAIDVINLDPGRSMIIDFCVFLKKPKDSHPILIYDNTFVADAIMQPGYNENGNIVPPNIDRAWSSECDNAARAAVVKNYNRKGYRIGFVRSNRFWDPNNYEYVPGWTDLSHPTKFDGLHPGQPGHEQIHEAAMLAINIVKP